MQQALGAIPGELRAQRSRIATRLDRILAIATEVPAAVLLVLEVAILLSGVVSRYAFHSPIGWTDELASILFLWLNMFGAAIALRRGAHMRLTAVVDLLPSRARARVEAFGMAAALLFLLLLIGPAVQYVEQESIVTTPALGISNGVRVAAIAVGFALMSAIALLQLLRQPRRSDVLFAVVLLAAAVALLYLVAPSLKGLGNANLLIYFGVVITACLFLGVPIAFAFGLSALAYLLLATRAPMLVILGRAEEGMSHLILLAVPLFVLLGVLMEITGLARAMITFLASLLGHVRGGLDYVLLGGMYLVSGISGAKVADMAAVAPVLFPEMKRRGQDPGAMVALLATSGAMAETIPPSLVLITIGSVTGISIAALFTGGLLPALAVASALGVVAYLRSRKYDMSGIVRAPGAVVWKSFLVALPALFLPVVIRTAVVEGVATATEVSTLGIVYAVLLGLLVYRQFDWSRICGLLVDTVVLSGAILFIIGTATAMAWALTQSGFSSSLAAAMARVPGGATGFMAISIVVFVVLGSVLEGIPALVLFGPLLFPVARTFGIHEVQYAMVVVLAMGIGLFAPPFGVGYYIACAIGKVPPANAIRPMGPYLAALAAGLALVAGIPWLSTGFL